jgi:hypothetical protein
MKALRDIDIVMPEVVHQLAIQPRNLGEYAYRRPNKTTATRAYEIAELVEKAMHPVVDRGAILSIGWCISYDASTVNGVRGFEVLGIEGEPMLFVDAVHKGGAALIISPERNEIHDCPMSDFSADQERELALLLNPNWTCPITAVAP